MEYFSGGRRSVCKVASIRKEYSSNEYTCYGKRSYRDLLTVWFPCFMSLVSVLFVLHGLHLYDTCDTNITIARCRLELVLESSWSSNAASPSWRKKAMNVHEHCSKTKTQGKALQQADHSDPVRASNKQLEGSPSTCTFRHCAIARAARARPSVQSSKCSLAAISSPISMIEGSFSLLESPP